MNSHCLRIFHVTDLHIFGDKQTEFLGINTYKNLLAVAENIQQRHLERNESDACKQLLIVTGDISQDYSLSSYENALTLMKQITLPIRFIPGNHDNSDILRQWINEDTIGAIDINFNQSFEANNWQIILLNSQWINHVAGLLEDKTLNFLRQELTNNNQKHIMIFLHHHVLSTGSAWLDKINLVNAKQFLNIVNNHSNIKAITSGHAHQEFIAKQNEIYFHVTPATAFQFKPQNHTFKLDAQMPGYRIIDLFTDGRYTTEVVRL